MRLSLRCRRPGAPQACPSGRRTVRRVGSRSGRLPTSWNDRLAGLEAASAGWAAKSSWSRPDDRRLGVASWIRPQSVTFRVRLHDPAARRRLDGSPAAVEVSGGVRGRRDSEQRQRGHCTTAPVRAAGTLASAFHERPRRLPCDMCLRTSTRPRWHAAHTTPLRIRPLGRSFRLNVKVSVAGVAEEGVSAELDALRQASAQWNAAVAEFVGGRET
jgi:hypothetical protein